MNETSEEQQNIINKIKESKNVIVDACAGSGKSTTILSTAIQIPEKQILQLTYNATLRCEIKEKIKDLKLDNIIVHTFHSLAVRFYLPNAHNDSALRRIIHNNLSPKEKIPKFDIIVIDETQDMTFLYYQFVIKFTKVYGFSVSIISFG
jgi:superfamily I DNA/RNA helicase